MPSVCPSNTAGFFDTLLSLWSLDSLESYWAFRENSFIKLVWIMHPAVTMTANENCYLEENGLKITGVFIKDKLSLILVFWQCVNSVVVLHANNKHAILFFEDANMESPQLSNSLCLVNPS